MNNYLSREDYLLFAAKVRKHHEKLKNNERNLSGRAKDESKGHREILREIIRDTNYIAANAFGSSE